MKFTLSVAVLALAASQVMAVIPIPIKGCTKQVVVQPTDTGCDAFATANGCTFADLLKWNDKLRPDCANLDVGQPLCVSITPGAGGKTNATTSAVPKPTSGAVVPTSAPVPAKGTSTGAAATTTTTGATNPQISTVAKGSSATSTKASMLLGAAGVIMSAVYML
ncbi:hypothetical protein CPC16_002233 [Podila verticillata]|nr:hypothetical protein CPC16_002233 [Podila verticillata]KAI9236315.1 MAG: hypothetical protein BYD32DRAFT_437592 [Podila humilis]